MYASLGGKLPWITEFVLSVPWVVWAVLPCAAYVASLVLALDRDRSPSRVIAASFSALIVWLVVAVVTLGMQFPIWELQRALS